MTEFPSRPTHLFITGTDTDVGKTVVTAALAAGLRAARAAKPVASGVQDTPVDDARVLAAAGGHNPLCYASYKAPISPHRAAQLEGRQLDIPALLTWLRGLTGSPLLVEGVGGWRVPLSEDPPFEVADLAVALGAPVIVVAPNRIGVLNHTLLTVDAIGAVLPVAAVVLNSGIPSDSSSPYNLGDLRSRLEVPVLELPAVDPREPASLARAGRDLWEGMPW